MKAEVSARGLWARMLALVSLISYPRCGPAGLCGQYCWGNL